MSDIKSVAPKPRLPPRWFMRFFWHAHRRVYGLSGGRFGLKPTQQSRPILSIGELSIWPLADAKIKNAPTLDQLSVVNTFVGVRARASPIST